MGVTLKLDLAVTAVEDVETPAGKFHCYKVELSPLNQTLWVSDQGARPVVQMDSGGARLHLASL